MSLTDSTTIRQTGLYLNREYSFLRAYFVLYFEDIQYFFNITTPISFLATAQEINNDLRDVIASISVGFNVASFMLLSKTFLICGLPEIMFLVLVLFILRN
jgi:hypothetical protein